MLTAKNFDLLRRLSLRPLTVVDLVTPTNIRMVQDLVKLGYARDYADQKGRRVEVRLRIWGITGAGKAVLEQQDLIEANTKQPSLPLFSKKLPGPFPPKRGFDDQRMGALPRPKQLSKTSPPNSPPAKPTGKKSPVEEPVDC